VETIYTAIRDKVSYESCGLCANYPYIAQGPAADSVDGVAVVFTGPFDTEKIDMRLGCSLIEQKSSFAGADFDVDRPFLPEDLAKINLSIQIFWF
jgi:hypothetical protein